jgi:hypothetical protein
MPGARGRIARHVDFLGSLLSLWAAFNAIVSVSCACFAAAAAVLAVTADPAQAGTAVASSVTAAGFLVFSVLAAIWAGVHGWCGRAVRRRDRNGRLLALVLAVGNALLFPLGTLLAGYTLWVLLQDERRALFLMEQ